MNYLLLATLVMMDIFLSDYNGKDRLMNLVRLKTMRLVQVEKWHVKKLNAKNIIQNMSFRFTNTDVDGEDWPQCLLCTGILAADSMKPDK
jgi:hypothetical protein